MNPRSTLLSTIFDVGGLGPLTFGMPPWRTLVVRPFVTALVSTMVVSVFLSVLTDWSEASRLVATAHASLACILGQFGRDACRHLRRQGGLALPGATDLG